MVFSPKSLALYVLIDPESCANPLELCRDVLEGGAGCIQLRDKRKEVPAVARTELALAVRDLCVRFAVPFIVNDDLDLALAIRADGVHLGPHDLPVAEARRRAKAADPTRHLIIGASARTAERARKAEAEGADYLGIGAAFPTSTKADARCIGPEGIAEVATATTRPAVAIGGIDETNIAALAGSGVCGIAATAPFVRSSDPKRLAEALRALSDKLFAETHRKLVPTALSIAGSDSSGGAGIQADLKTFAAHHVYGMTALTALTAQNGTGVFAVETLSPEFLAAQIDAVFEGIPPKAVKIGMLPTPEQIVTVAERLRFYRAENIVLDPVLIATSGAALATSESARALCTSLFPLACVITPNLYEASVLMAQDPPDRFETMIEFAEKMAAELDVPVLLKGGHLDREASDVLAKPDGSGAVYKGRRIATKNTHGTGCTLSSAIAANLAKGMRLESAIAEGKRYLDRALRADPQLGQGNGPLDHAFAIEGRYA